jgi:lipid-binding SYLF domain-containing protein
MSAQVLSYSRSKGVFAGLELKGTVISQDTEHMEGVYHKGVTASEVLKENKVTAPAVVQVFPRTLSSYSQRKALR